MQTRQIKDMLLAAWLVGLATAFHPQKRADDQLPTFDWPSITPNENLEYHECYTAFQCARLKVPLDWTKGSKSDKSAALAIITLPATVPSTDPSFGGTILLNPGGPGGAGVSMVLSYGQYLRSILDGEKHYELLSFDPRGTSFSTPRAECYANDIDRTADELQGLLIPPVVSSREALSYLYQKNTGFSELCGQAGNDSIFNYMSTASVARDMLRIIDRVDDLQRSNSSEPAESHEKPKLQYIGTSYGTFLGNTFASMFPDRVKRMVIDGVVDPDDYLDTSMKKGLVDFDKIMEDFYQHCFDAGSACPLKKDSDKKPSSIRKRVERFISDLETSPIPVAYQGRTRLITSFAVRSMITLDFYSPILQYTGVAATLAQTMAGNHSAFLDVTKQTKTELETACIDPNATTTPSILGYSWQNEASLGVACGDGALGAGERSLSWAEDVVDFVSNQSSTAAEFWIKNSLSCLGWKYKPKEIFTGPFGSSPASSSYGDGKGTEAPLLILTSRYDPVTPLQHAWTVSKSHNGSAVVIQESLGHTALLAAKSNCTAKIVREYFNTGKVPRNGTTCEADCVATIPPKPCEGLSGAF